MEVKPDKGPWLSRSQVAKELGVSEPTISRWLAAGVLQGYKVGRAWRISPQSFNTFLNSTSNIKMSNEPKDT